MKPKLRQHRSVKPKVQLPKGHYDAHGHSQDCLNCGAELSGKYCSQCGQSAHTHRYSILSFLVHDFVHGIWHVEKSIFRTLWEVMIRPGTTARRNIAGQRARFFPIITLLLLLAGGYLALNHDDLLDFSEGTQVVIGNWELTEVVKHYQKWMFLGTIPLLALSSWMVYRRAHYNYSEHLVAACYAVASMFAWLCIFFVLPDDTADWVDWTMVSLFFCFGIYIQWQVYGSHYTAFGFAWRTLLFWVLFTLLVFSILFGLIVYAAQTGKI